MKAYTVTRRQFLKGAMGCCVSAALGGPWARWTAHAEERAVWPDLAVAHGDPGPATRKAIEALGGMRHFLKPGQKVVIKPNMSFPNPPEWATTTHPAVIRELVTLCREAGAASILVLDHPLRNTELCLERSQLGAVCQGTPQGRVEGLKGRDFFQEAPIPQGRDLKRTRVMKAVLAADVLIAAPVAKSHSATGVSLGMKGMMGLIYNRSELHWRMDLDTAIVDLCTLLKADLTVVDASRILSDNGPGGPGKVLPLNQVIASADMVAADAMAVERGTWYGRRFRADQVKHIRMAHERGLGRMDVAALKVREV